MASITHLESTLDPLEGTHNATTIADLADGARPFYRILALASSGKLIASTHSRQAAISKGECLTAI